jgi:chemotaxis protein MotB
VAAASNLPPIIVKRVKKSSHGAVHSSTTWKIALADFMTAMFIIFLLLWLINQTTPEQRHGIADYFSPASVTRNNSGSGAILGGQTITQPGAMRNDTAPVSPIRGGGPSAPQEGEGSTQVPGFPGTTQQLKGTQVGGEAKGGGRGPGAGGGKAIEQVEAGIRGIEGIPGGLERNITVERVEEGLRIQLVDSDKRELFARGSAQPLAQTRALMAQVAKIIDKVPNKIAIAGYTDGQPFGKGAAYTNWELSADRANASRRLLVEAGISDERMSAVTGKADHELLFPEDKTAPGNRRISITLLNEKSPDDAASATGAASGTTTASASGNRPPPGPAPEGRLIPR